MSRAQRRLGTDLQDPETRPWFLWDEDLSVRELRAILATESHPRRGRRRAFWEYLFQAWRRRGLIP